MEVHSVVCVCVDVCKRVYVWPNQLEIKKMRITNYF